MAIRFAGGQDDDIGIYAGLTAEKVVVDHFGRHGGDRASPFRGSMRATYVAEEGVSGQRCHAATFGTFVSLLAWFLGKVHSQRRF